MARVSIAPPVVNQRQVNLVARKYLLGVLRRILPDGEPQGRYWVSANPQRPDRRSGSFKVEFKSGVWRDYATGDKGRDPISLAAFVAQEKPERAAQWLAEMLGVRNPGNELTNRPPMFDPLTADEMAYALTRTLDEEIYPIVPVPDDAPAMTYRHPRRGIPTESYDYRTLDGKLIGYMLRFDSVEDGEPVKEFLVVTFCQTEDGDRWRPKGFPKPHPLYRQQEIQQREDAIVLVCEGEKTALAAALLFPEMATTTTPFGAQAAASADWSLLSGRRVVVSPDYDEPGEHFGSEVSELAYKAGALEVLLLKPEKIAGWVWRDGRKLRRDFPPEGWDLGDAAGDGWTAETLREEIQQPDVLTVAPKPLVFGEDGRSLFRMGKDGVERRCGAKKDSPEFWKLICGPLEVLAETRDEEGGNWGKLLKIINPDKRGVEWVMPCESLAGDGSQVRGALLSRGLVTPTSDFGREMLQEYLATASSPARALCVDRVGWHGGCYLAGAHVFGQRENDDRILLKSSRHTKIGQTSGTLAGWQSTVGSLAIGNPIIMFALCAAFAAPLIVPLRAESGGFHFVGSSSIGKTTALYVAGSVWGGGGTAGYANSWRATSNGLEGVAAAHCDGLLCLDEMGQVRSQEAAQCAYMLANGVGKLRANRQGDSRPPAEWRTIFLSTGEIGLADKIGEDSRNADAAAGQQVRIIDLAADGGASLGIFRNIHDHPSVEAFSRSLKEGSETHYGHAGLAFLARFIGSLEDETAKAKEHIELFVSNHCATPVDGQVKRVARKFGLVAAAGELAISYGILPGASGVAFGAVGACFTRWLSSRGTRGSLEDETAVAHVKAFIEQHGTSRFGHNEYEDANELESKVRDRVGIRRKTEDGHEYCFFTEAWAKTVCKGRDAQQVARVLAARDLLSTEPNRLTKQVKIKGRNCRMYVIKDTILLDPEEIGSPPASLGGFYGEPNLI